MAENPKEESDTDDERARRMSDFLRDPDINVKWTDYNLAKNRLARGKGKGKIVRPNSPLESPRNSPASEPPSIPGTSRPSRPSPVRPPTRSASPRSQTRSGSRSTASRSPSPRIRITPFDPDRRSQSRGSTPPQKPIRDRLQNRLVKEKRTRSHSSSSESETDKRPRLKSSERQSDQRKSRKDSGKESRKDCGKESRKEGGKRSKSYTIPKTSKIQVRFPTSANSTVKETGKILFDPNLTLPAFEPSKLRSSLSDMKFCSFYQFDNCPQNNVLYHMSKGTKYAHACASCYRISSILIPHSLKLCPFTKVFH